MYNKPYGPKKQNKTKSQKQNTACWSDDSGHKYLQP